MDKFDFWTGHNHDFHGRKNFGEEGISAILCTIDHLMGPLNIRGQDKALIF